MPETIVNRRIALKNILVATDFSVPSEIAFAYAREVAKTYGSKMFVAHVVPMDPPVMATFEAVPETLDLAWQVAQEKMTAFLADAQDAKPEALIGRGPLWDVMDDMIARNDIDLVVMGTHGRRGVAKLVLGSAAEEVFRLAKCPVLTVGPQAPEPVFKKGFKNILFTTDFAEGNESALAYALSVAEEHQARLTLLHTIPLVPVEYQVETAAEARKRLLDMVPPDANLCCKAEAVVSFDFPGEGIVRTATNREADLIVMGVKGSSVAKLDAHLPWHTAHDVVCRAHCPVLTVRHN